MEGLDHGTPVLYPKPEKLLPAYPGKRIYAGRDARGHFDHRAHHGFGWPACSQLSWRIQSEGRKDSNRTLRERPRSLGPRHRTVSIEFRRSRRTDASPRRRDKLEWPLSEGERGAE